MSEHQGDADKSRLDKFNALASEPEAAEDEERWVEQLKKGTKTKILSVAEKP